MIYRISLGMSWGAAIAAVWLAPAGHADANSYLAYLTSHNVTFNFASDGRKLSAGISACQQLHTGQTPQQVADSWKTPFGIPIADFTGVIEAAQQELCPDTLGHR